MFRLGRKAVIQDSRTVKLSKYLTSVLPTPPVSVDWTKNQTSWGMDLNDTLGDCTIAGCLHAIQVWSLNANTEATLPDSTALEYYEKWDGYNPNDPSSDQGGILLNVAKNWKNEGLAGHKIELFASVNHTNQTEVQTAIDLFGGLYIGFNVPSYIMDDNSKIWDVSNTDNSIEGGHCVYICGFDQTYLTVISWGSIYRMTYNFWKEYVDESYCILSDDWFNKSGVDPAGLNLTQLKTDIGMIR
ncbi:Uncharacterised protein [uncultured archaeon]|nr:Uncharacterised protein [uncultured archaeon]